MLRPKCVFRLCKAIEKNIQLGTGERGGVTGGVEICFLFSALGMDVGVL